MQMDEKIAVSTSASPSAQEVGTTGEIIFANARPGKLHRELNGPQVQLFAIGTAIGTGVFVSMGSYLPIGGPAGLFLGFLAWSAFALGINQCYGKYRIASGDLSS